MTRPSMRPAAIGCRSHSGWAALVTIAGSRETPQVIDRRRIETFDTAIRGSKQPFHAAEPLEFHAAEDLIQRCARNTARLSERALRETMEEVGRGGYRVESCGIALASGRALPELKAILASHALIHTAEGEFYRDALAEAGRACGLKICGVREKELYERGAAHLQLTTQELERRVTALGKPLGPPWSQDQKFAALLAWLALTSYPRE
jgi:hypothetical protein